MLSLAKQEVTVSWLNRVSNLFHRNQVGEELDEEMQFTWRRVPAQA